MLYMQLLASLTDFRPEILGQTQCLNASLHLRSMQHIAPGKICVHARHCVELLKGMFDSCLFGVFARLQFAINLFLMAFACAMSRRGWAYFSTPGMPNVLPYILVQ